MATPPTRLLYVDRTELRSFDLGTGASELIVELPSADVAVSPDGNYFAVVRETDPRGSTEEGFRTPEVFLGDVTSGRELAALGPGRSPHWHRDSSRVAVIEPAAAGERIVVYDTNGERLDLPGRAAPLWTIVGWMGDEVVAIGGDAGVVALQLDRDTARALEVAPAEIWGVSPRDESLLSVGARGGVITGDDRTLVDVDDALGDGSWSWDGRSIASVVVSGVATRLALIDAATGSSREVAGGRGAQGNVVWWLDGKTFGFVRVDPTRRGRLQAIVCINSTECSAAFSWDEGVRLLGFV